MFGCPATGLPEPADRRIRRNRRLAIRPVHILRRRLATKRQLATVKPVTRTVRMPQSTRLVRPNAVCPACGAQVNFYSNEHGSRVYFDEVGPPWPRHPCTDNYRPDTSSGPSSSRRSAPVLYPSEVGRRKIYTERVPDSVRRKAFTVVHVRHSGDSTVLGLQAVYQNASAGVDSGTADLRSSRAAGLRGQRLYVLHGRRPRRSRERRDSTESDCTPITAVQAPTGVVEQLVGT